MMSNYLCICNCVLCCVPYAFCFWNCELTTIWLAIWFFVNGCIFQDSILGLLSGTYSLSEFTDTLPSLPLESFALFLFMLCNIIMLMMIINTPPGNDYSNRSEKFYTLNCFQCLLMFYTQSSFSSEYKFILLLCPLVFGMLYGCTAKFDVARCTTLCAIWAFFNIAQYFGPWTYSKAFEVAIYWAVLPFIEFSLVVYACGGAVSLTLEAFESARHKIPSRYPTKRYYNINSSNFTSGYIFGIILAYTLLSGLEYILKIMHGYYPTANSFIFFGAYLCPLGELAIYHNAYDIHKCNISKLSFLSYTSILGSAYVVRYAFNL